MLFFVYRITKTDSMGYGVWPQFLPQTNTEHAETVDKKCPNRKCLGVETAWKHAKRTKRRTHVSWGGRGRWFKSSHSDQIKPKTNRFRLYFLHFQGKIGYFPTTFAPPEIPKIFWPHVWPQLEQRQIVWLLLLWYALLKKLNSKGSRRYSLREPFSLFTAYQFLNFNSRNLH